MEYDPVLDLERTLAAVVAAAGGEVRVPVSTIRSSKDLKLTATYYPQTDEHVYKTTTDPRIEKARRLASILATMTRADEIEEFLLSSSFNDEPLI
jgi:hypothetical protein